jgi:hypothetical protein
VYAGHVKVVEAIAQQAVTNQSVDAARNHQTYAVAEHLSFRQAICTGINLQRNDIVTYLLKKYVQAFGPTTEACMTSWLHEAVTCGHKHMLELLIRTPTQAGASTFYKAFETACELQKPSLLCVFFSSPIQSPGPLSINQVYPSAYHRENLTYPLLDAMLGIKIQDADCVVLRELLRLGADPDGPSYRATLMRPLCLACRHKTDMCFLLLLGKGADTSLIDSARLEWRQRKKFDKWRSKALSSGIASRNLEESKPPMGVEECLAEKED